MSTQIQGKAVVTTKNGFIGENKIIVPCISQAKVYSVKYARTLAKRDHDFHAIPLETAVCVYAHDTHQFVTQRSLGQWHGLDCQLDYAALLTLPKAEQQIARLSKSRFKREWQIKRYVEFLEAA